MATATPIVVDVLDVSRTILEIHSHNGHGWCQGCGVAHGAWVERWPCETVLAIKDAWEARHGGDQ